MNENLHHLFSLRAAAASSYLPRFLIKDSAVIFKFYTSIQLSGNVRSVFKSCITIYKMLHPPLLQEAVAKVAVKAKWLLETVLWQVSQRLKLNQVVKVHLFPSALGWHSGWIAKVVASRGPHCVQCYLTSKDCRTVNPAAPLTISP